VSSAPDGSRCASQSSLPTKTCTSGWLAALIGFEWVFVCLAVGSLLASIAALVVAMRILQSVNRSEISGEERLEILREQQQRLESCVKNAAFCCAPPMDSEVTLRKIAVLSQLPTHSVLRDDDNLERLAFG
jgi:hypothetical protein